jgi:hypothetical protein
MAIMLPPRQSFGGAFGQGLGSGLSSMFQSLASQKMEEMQKKKEADALENAGYPRELAYVSDKTLQFIMNDLAEKKQAQQEQQSQRDIQELRYGIQQEQSPQITQQIGNEVARDQSMGIEQAQKLIQQQLGLPTGAKQSLEQLISQSQQQNITPQQPLQSMNQLPSFLSALQPKTGQESLSQFLQRKQPEAFNVTATPEFKQWQQQRAQEFKKGYRPLTKQERAEREARLPLEARKAWQTEKKENQAIINDRFKLYKPDIDKAFEKASDSRSTLHRIDEMRKLTLSGELPNQSFYNFLEAWGLNVPSFIGVKGERFEKLKNDWVREARNFFGARVTNHALETFFKRIPTLSQTPEGRLSILADLERFEKLNLAEEKAYSHYLKHYKKKDQPLPLTLKSKIASYVEKETPQIDKEYEEQLENATLLPQKDFIHRMSEVLWELGAKPAQFGTSILKAIAGLRGGV